MDTPLGNGIFVFILGLLIIFLGMLIIVLAVSICGKVFSKLEEAKKPVKKVEVKPVEAQNNEEIPTHVKVAIITAISAYYFNQKSKCDFVVKKIKKI